MVLSTPIDSNYYNSEILRHKKLRALEARTHPCLAVRRGYVKKIEATTQHGALYSASYKISIQYYTKVVILFLIDSTTRNLMALSKLSSDDAEYKKTTTWVQGGKIRTYGTGGAVVGPA